MKQRLILLTSIFAMALFAIACQSEQSEEEVIDYIVVDTIEEMIPYLSQSDVCVKLSPGTYRIDQDFITDKKYSVVTVEEDKISVFLVSGNRSIYDFTDVTLEIDTQVWNMHEYGEFIDLHIIGISNTVKGLKIVDDGDKLYFPKNGCTNVVIDGINNTIEGIEIHSTGSYPYGYGEVFGKGGTNTIVKHYKHCALLVRGDYNKVMYCNVYHKAYGHFIFMQAAENPTIEGCYIEGEMSTTDAILAEAGTGSEADKVDFMTTWGYTLPAGYTIALGEDGIRSYNAGTTIMNGEVTSRGSKNITVKDCVVKHARAGVSLTLSSGTRSVDNVTLIGCQSGFAVGGSAGSITNCKADAAFGPAYVDDYSTDKNTYADITIMPYEGEVYSGNGSKHLAEIFGTGHTIILKKGEGLEVDPNLEIILGGDSNKIGNLDQVTQYAATSMKVTNQTGYPINLSPTATDVTIVTNGEIVGDGDISANDVTYN